MDRRHFVMSTGALAGLAIPFGAQAKAVSGARATRLDGERVQLNWTGGNGAATVLVSSDPAASRLGLRPLETGLKGGQAIVMAPSLPRPYFIIASGFGNEVRVAERILPLQGGRNFRDLGGYIGTGGKAVKWGRIYRSGVMSSLTRPDVAYLASLGISVVCDLRSAQERSREPSMLIGDERVKIMSHDYELASSMSRLTQSTTRAQAIEAFSDAYLNFATILKPQYTDMFASLVDSDAPFALNCSAGKDRTGVGSALILSVLGVDRASVIADYGLTETYTPVSFYMNLMRTPQEGASTRETATQANPYTRLPPEVSSVILGSVPEVMRLTLARMDREFGGPVELAKQRFGLTDAGIAKMRRKYLL
jgi:protein-tyrosine phosphatase